MSRHVAVAVPYGPISCSFTSQGGGCQEPGAAVPQTLPLSAPTLHFLFFSAGLGWAQLLGIKFVMRSRAGSGVRVKLDGFPSQRGLWSEGWEVPRQPGKE